MRSLVAAGVLAVGLVLVAVPATAGGEELLDHCEQLGFNLPEYDQPGVEACVDTTGGLPRVVLRRC